MSAVVSQGAGLPLREKIGYGLGDTASNLVFQLALNFITRFYTDVAFIDPLQVGFILLAVRIIDAITDPVMGVLADRTSTKWGQYRPFLIWIAVPFGLAAILAFSIPELSQNGKFIYAMITYAVLMIAYTAINIPYCALAASMTDDPDERTSVQSWRFAGGQTGNLIVSAMTLPLVAYLGNGDDALGWRYTAIVYGVFSVLLFVLCFALTRERVVVRKEVAPTNIWQDLKALWKNDQWRALALIQLFLLSFLVMRATVTFYFVDEFYGEVAGKGAGYLVTAYFTLGSIGAIVGSFQASRVTNGGSWSNLGLLAITQVGLSALFVFIGIATAEMAIAATIAVVIGVIVSDLFGMVFGRISALAMLFVAQAMAHVALFAIGGGDFLMSLGVFVGIMFLNQVSVPIIWSLMTDSVDYGELKTGKRLAGLNFSANLFALKIGVTVGGTGAAWILAFYGYNANLPEQSEHTMMGIMMAFALIPAALCLVTALLSARLKLTRSEMHRIQEELNMRRAAAEGAE